MLKTVSESTDSCGTPSGTSLCGWCGVVDSVGKSTCKKGRQPLPAVCVDVCSVYFRVRCVLGTMSKTLLMSIVTRSVKV